MRRAVLMMRQAISPLFAMRILENIRGWLSISPQCHAGLVPGSSLSSKGDGEAIWMPEQVRGDGWWLVCSLPLLHRRHIVAQQREQFRRRLDHIGAGPEY